MVLGARFAKILGYALGLAATVPQMAWGELGGPPSLSPQEVLSAPPATTHTATKPGTEVAEKPCLGSRLSAEDLAILDRVEHLRQSVFEGLSPAQAAVNMQDLIERQANGDTEHARMLSALVLLDQAPRDRQNLLHLADRLARNTPPDAAALRWIELLKRPEAEGGQGWPDPSSVLRSIGINNKNIVDKLQKEGAVLESTGWDLTRFNFQRMAYDADLRSAYLKIFPDAEPVMNEILNPKRNQPVVLRDHVFLPNTKPAGIDFKTKIMDPRDYRQAVVREVEMLSRSIDEILKTSKQGSGFGDLGDLVFGKWGSTTNNGYDKIVFDEINRATQTVARLRHIYGFPEEQLEELRRELERAIENGLKNRDDVMSSLNWKAAAIVASPLIAPVVSTGGVLAGGFYAGLGLTGVSISSQALGSRIQNGEPFFCAFIRELDAQGPQGLVLSLAFAPVGVVGGRIVSSIPKTFSAAGLTATRAGVVRAITLGGGGVALYQGYQSVRSGLEDRAKAKIADAHGSTATADALNASAVKNFIDAGIIGTGMVGISQFFKRGLLPRAKLRLSSGLDATELRYGHFSVGAKTSPKKLKEGLDDLMKRHPETQTISIPLEDLIEIGVLEDGAIASAELNEWLNKNDFSKLHRGRNAMGQEVMNFKKPSRLEKTARLPVAVAKGVKNKATGFASEVRRDGAKRLLVKTVPLDAPVDPKAVAHQEKLSWSDRATGAAMKVMDVEGTVLNPVLNSLARPVRGTRREFSNFVLIPAGVFGTGYLGSHALEGASNWYKRSHQDKLNKEHQVEWLALIEGDFRYSEVRERLAKGEVSPEVAVKMAVMIQSENLARFNQISIDMQNGEITPQLGRFEMLDLPMFAHLADWVVEGPPRGDLILAAGAPAQLDEKHIDRLLVANQVFLKKADLIRASLLNKIDIRKVEDPQQREFLRSLDKNPFLASLKALESRGEIKRSQVIVTMQEAYFYDLKMQEFAIVGVDASKNFSSVADFQAALIEELRAKTPQPPETPSRQK